MCFVPHIRRRSSSSRKRAQVAYRFRLAVLIRGCGIKFDCYWIGEASHQSADGLGRRRGRQRPDCRMSNKAFARFPRVITPGSWPPYVAHILLSGRGGGRGDDNATGRLRSTLAELDSAPSGGVDIGFALVRVNCKSADGEVFHSHTLRLSTHMVPGHGASGAVYSIPRDPRASASGITTP